MPNKNKGANKKRGDRIKKGSSQYKIKYIKNKTKYKI
jgi:hypothetical protein